MCLCMYVLFYARYVCICICLCIYIYIYILLIPDSSAASCARCRPTTAACAAHACARVVCVSMRKQMCSQETRT